MTSYFQLIVIHFWQKILAIKNPLDLILAPSKGGMQCVCTHMTRSQNKQDVRSVIKDIYHSISLSSYVITYYIQKHSNFGIFLYIFLLILTLLSVSSWIQDGLIF